MSRSVSVLACLIVAECGPRVRLEGASGDGGTSGGADDVPVSMSGVSTEHGGGESSSTTEPVCDYEPEDTWECNPYDDDCPEGLKCVPGFAWFDSAVPFCAPIDERFGLGEACVIEGFRGLEDHCPDGAVCLSSCLALCGCHPRRPQCDDPCADCAVLGGGGLCMPACNPFREDCVAEIPCKLSSLNPDYLAFHCEPQNTIGPGLLGACESTSECDPGQACMRSDLVSPGRCAGEGCCTPICDTNDPTACSAVAPGLDCVSLAESLRPGCYPNNIGYCSGAR